MAITDTIDLSQPASGAVAGAPAGPIGAAIGGGLGLAAALLTRKKKIKGPNKAAQLAEVEAGTAKQKELATGLTSSLSPLSTQYKTDTGALSAALRKDVADRGAAYKTEAANLGTEQATNLSNALRRNVLSAQPEIQAQLKESLAATGGLGRGAATAAFSRAGQAAAEEIGRGETAIQTQRLQGLQDAAKTVFGADLGAIQQATGLDASSLETLFQSGRQDLIREAQSIMQAERDRTQNRLAIEANANTYNIAQQTADAAGSNALTQALLEQLGRGAGGYIQSKFGGQ